MASHAPPTNLEDLHLGGTHTTGVIPSLVEISKLGRLGLKGTWVEGSVGTLGPLVNLSVIYLARTSVHKRKEAMGDFGHFNPTCALDLAAYKYAPLRLFKGPGSLYS